MCSSLLCVTLADLQPLEFVDVVSKLASERSSSRFDFAEAHESAIPSLSPANAPEIPAAGATVTVAPVAPAVIPNAPEIHAAGATVTVAPVAPAVIPMVATPTAATPTAADEKAIQERAFWIWKETGCDDPVANYFRALREVQGTLREPFESSRGLFEPDAQAGVVR